MAVAPLWQAIFQRSDPSYHGLPLKSAFPFFDLRLTSFMQAVPARELVRAKALLRTAMRDRLPMQILQRPKTTLPPDLYQRLLAAQGIAEWQRDVISGAAIREWVDPAWLAKIGNGATEQGLSAFAPLNSAINLAYWLSRTGR